MSTKKLYFTKVSDANFHNLILTSLLKDLEQSLI